MSLDQARKFYNQALKTDPKCMEAYRGLAQVEQNCGNYQGALAWYRKGLAVDAKQAPLWYEMGICQARHGDWPAAQDSVSKACDLEADNRIYVKTLAFCFAKNGRYDDSVACFKRVMDEGQAHYNLACALLRQGKHEEAAAHCQHVLRFLPDFPEAHNNLATALVGQDLMEEAIHHWHEALRLRLLLLAESFEGGRRDFAASEVFLLPSSSRSSRDFRMSFKCLSFPQSIMFRTCLRNST